STADDLREFYNLPAEKISVIHSGIGSEFFEVRPQLIEDGPQRNLPEKYFLSLGTIEPRKNIAGVVRAFDTLKTSGQVGADAHLVIAGNLGWDYAEVKNLITKSSWQKQIKLLGAIKPENLPELYQRAKVFVYPSFFEGFGFPPLEAMASGVPVIAGNNSSFPETLGQAALLVDSYSQTELATAMAAAWNDQSLRSKLIANGQKQSKNFSWQKAAEETLSLAESR
ncbi:MAG: Glycosyl transferase group 1, partial [Parcubacteria group bacterium GW2011_GWB1_48_6]